MGNNNTLVLALIALVLCVVAAGGCLLYDSKVSGPQINGLEATGIVLSDSYISEYYSSYFRVEDWRVTTTTLVDATPNGNTSEEGVWMIEIMERTCACSGVKDLLVIEGYVSAIDGELFEVDTKFVSESEYEKETCSSTACH